MEPITFTVETSAGRMDARWGWSGWISLTTPRSVDASHAAKRLVERRDDLEELLVGFGLGRTESRRIARDLWERRPDGAPPGDGPVEQPGQGRTLLGIAIGVMVALALLVLLLNAAG
jgi:hypothetical protein